jgi:hypothetical protein
MQAENIEVSNTVPETPATSVISYEGSAWGVDLGVKIPFRMGANAQCGKIPERDK